MKIYVHNITHVTILSQVIKEYAPSSHTIVVRPCQSSIHILRMT